MRSSIVTIAVCAVALAGCQAKSPPPFNPDDPAAIAQIDSLMRPTLEAAASADADKVLGIADGPGEFTFITGDMLLAGAPTIRDRFRATYAGVARQNQQIETRRVRMLTPDVALFTAVGEGTYTDKSGWTSPPVGLGLTVVFVRVNGRWQAQHAHQSIAF